MRKIIIHRNDPDEPPGYWVECPSLGIASAGDTVAEAIEMIKDAIALHIEDLTAYGDPVPPEDVLPDELVEQEVIVA